MSKIYQNRFFTTISIESGQITFQMYISSVSPYCTSYISLNLQKYFYDIHWSMIHFYIFLWYFHDIFLHLSIHWYPMILKCPWSPMIFEISHLGFCETCTGVTGIQQRRLVSEAAEGQRFLDQTGGLVKLTLKQFMRENLSGLSPKMRVTLTEWFFRTRVSANIYESGLGKLSPESPDSQLSVSLSLPFRSLQRVLSDNVLLVKYRQLGMPSTRYHSLKIAEQHQGSPLF